MHKKSCSMILTLLILMNTLILAFDARQISAEPKTWIVDDDGPGDFHSIEEAVISASNGDTILVREGYYSEIGINVNKSLKIIADGSVIIDGQGVDTEIFDINSNDVTISGFTLINTNWWCIDLYRCSRVLVKNNIIKNCKYGIILSYSKNNVIEQNFIQVRGDGIDLSDSDSNNIIKNNKIEYGDNGIEGWSCDASIISNNEFKAKGKDPGSAISLDLGDNNIIERNSCDSGTGFDITGNGNVICDNILLNSSYGFSITGNNNTISNNIIEKGDIRLISSSNCSIYRNFIMESFEGIYLHECRDIIVKENIINGSFWTGIYLIQTTDSILDKNVINNTMVSGIWIDNSYRNIVTENFVGNSYGGEYWHGIGILIYDSRDNIIYHNNFINNKFKNADINNIKITSINTWDDGYPSGGNYWSDYTGVDANGDGIGDTPYIIDENNVDHYPLMKPYEIPVAPPVQRYILHVQSYPITEIQISYSGDYSGTGMTNFDIGPENSPFTVTLTAPLTHRDYTFDHWELDGVNQGGSLSLTVNIGDKNKERTILAVYSKAFGESGDISILDLKSVQVVYSNILVANKPTLLKVDFSNSFTHIVTTQLKISYAEQSLTEMVELPMGVTSFFLPSNTWILFKNEGKYEITVNLDPENVIQETNENNNEVKLSVSVKESKSPRIIYVPIEIGDSKLSKEQFESFIRDSSDFIRDVYPVASVVTYNGWESRCDLKIWIPGYSTLFALSYLKGILYGSGIADCAVGVLPKQVEGWLGISTPYFPISGACLVVYGDPQVVAHEIGHNYGLWVHGLPPKREEYDFYYYGKSVDGYWVSKRKMMRTCQMSPDGSFNVQFTLPSSAPNGEYSFFIKQVFDISVDARNKKKIIFEEKMLDALQIGSCFVEVYGPTRVFGLREKLLGKEIQISLDGTIKFDFEYSIRPGGFTTENLAILVHLRIDKKCASGDCIVFNSQVQIDNASILSGSSSIRCVTTGFSYEPFPDVYCFMGSFPCEFDAWICSDDYNQLFDKLVQNPRDPRTVMVSGLIFRNGTVQLLPWYSLDDRVVDLDIGSTGNYSLLMLNDKGETLGVIGFNMSFLEGYNVTGFAFTIPYIEGLRKVILKHENVEIAERVVSYNKPNITLTYPNKGEIFKKGETIKIKWNAIDEDGDALYYSIFYSLDGKNFLPLAFNLMSPFYEWSPSEALEDKNIIIKVMVSDGVNTNEDVSDYAIRISTLSEIDGWWIQNRLWILFGFVGVTVIITVSVALIRKRKRLKF